MLSSNGCQTYDHVIAGLYARVGAETEGGVINKRVSKTRMVMDWRLEFHALQNQVVEGEHEKNQPRGTFMQLRRLRFLDP